MITLLVALLVSGVLSYLGKRFAANAFPAKKVNIALLAASATVLMFFVAVEYIGFAIALSALFLLLIGSGGVAGWMVMKERHRTVLSQAIEEMSTTTNYPLHTSDVPNETNETEPPVLFAHDQDAAPSSTNDTAPLDGQAAIDELLREFWAQNEAAVQVNQTGTAAKTESMDMEKTPEESVTVEDHAFTELEPLMDEDHLDRLLAIEITELRESSQLAEDGASEISENTDTDQDEDQDLLLSDLSALLDESECTPPSKKEHAYKPPAQPEMIEASERRKLVLQLDEITGNQDFQNDFSLELPSEQTIKLFELEEITDVIYEEKG
jgi:hypothetical protein